MFTHVLLFTVQTTWCKKSKRLECNQEIDEETIRLREEVNLQYQALQQVVRLGDLYGVDVRKPAMNVKEAIQWVNIAFMAVCRVINGAATSLGRVPIVWTSLQNVTLLVVHLLNQKSKIRWWFRYETSYS